MSDELNPAPRNTQPINELWAILSVDDGGEGIMSMQLPQLGTTPMVFGYRRVLDRVLPLAQQFAEKHGKQIKVARFVRSE
jgi:hypothetical protein